MSNSGNPGTNYNNLLALLSGKKSAGSSLRDQDHTRGVALLLITTSLAEAGTAELWKSDPRDSVKLLLHMRNSAAHADCDMAKLSRKSVEASQLLANDFANSGGHGFYEIDKTTPTKFWLFPNLGEPSSAAAVRAREAKMMRAANWLFATLASYMNPSPNP